MGTPIINLPQTGVLGLHAIKDKPVAINGRVEIRPVRWDSFRRRRRRRRRLVFFSPANGMGLHSDDVSRSNVRSSVIGRS